MKAIIEYMIVAMIAVLMAFSGHWLIGWYSGNHQSSIEWTDPGWTVLSSAVSIVTWMILYRMCRRLHWLFLPVMGIFSPIIGAVLFFIPYTIGPFWVIWEYAVVVFPVGIATGFLVSLTTLPFRPKAVLSGNA
jgi:hypothetical protein